MYVCEREEITIGMEIERNWRYREKDIQRTIKIQKEAERERERGEHERDKRETEKAKQTRHTQGEIEL